MASGVPELRVLRGVWGAALSGIVVVPLAVALALRPSGPTPAWADALLWAGVLSAIAGWPAIARFRRAAEKTPRTAADLARLREALLLGLAIVDLPMLIGIAHYALSGDVRVLAGLSVLSLLLAVALRPPEE